VTGTLRPGLIHGSCVEVDGRAVLIIGASGSGKSGLALRLLALGAGLVGDDQIYLTQQETRILAHGVEALSGRIEARQIGILSYPASAATPVHLVVDLDLCEPSRLPPERKVRIGGTEIDLIFGKSCPNLAAAIWVWLQAGRID
jgi:HPr kinase/phosphorylase